MKSNQTSKEPYEFSLVVTFCFGLEIHFSTEGPGFRVFKTVDSCVFVS